MLVESVCVYSTSWCVFTLMIFSAVGCGIFIVLVGEPHEVLQGSNSIPTIVVTPYKSNEEEMEGHEEGGVAMCSGHNRPVKISSLPAMFVQTARPPMND